MSVEFEPVKLGPHRRRVDPVAIGALVVAIGLAAAVLKPWNAGAGPGATASDGTAAASAPRPTGLDSLSGPRATAAPVVPRIVTASTASSASWKDVRAVVRPHDAWGIRAIVAVPSATAAPVTDQRFAERWDPIANDSRGIPTIDIEPNDRTVVAIGITFPASHTPLDARIWLVHPDRLEWVDTQPMDPNPAGGAFLYQLVNGNGSVENWGAGRYRIDALVDGAVRRFGFTLPNRFGIVPDRSELPAAQGDLIDPAGGALPDLPIGLFATAEGVSIPLPAEAGPPLTEAAAWLNLDPGTGRAPRSYVAAAFVPHATGLGVTLPPGSVVQGAAIRRLVPEPLTADPALVRDPGAAPDVPASHVLFRALGGGPWQPGDYQISVVWTDPVGRHDRSWHVELRPGPVRELPSLLLATRGFARYAGVSGVVVGSAEPLEGEPRSVAIRLLRARPDGATGFPARDQVNCDGFRVDGLSGVIGLARPIDAPSTTVTARVLFEFTRWAEQPILTAAGDVPGLTLIAPAGATSATGSTVCLSFTPVG